MYFLFIINFINASRTINYYFYRINLSCLIRRFELTKTVACHCSCNDTWGGGDQCVWPFDYKHICILY